MVDARIQQAFENGKINTTAYAYITEEYLSETRDDSAVGAIIFLLALTTAVVGLRIFSRVFLVKRFGLDDGLAMLGFVFFLVFVAQGLILIKEGSGRHIEFIQYILTHSQINQTEVDDYAAHLVYTSALFICRLSGLAFFHRLCVRHNVLVRFIYGATVFLICAFLPQFFLILLHCNPTTGLWPYQWQSEYAEYTCLNWGVVYVTNSSLSLVCDFVIFSIPIAIISNLKLSKERKIMLAFVLLPGTLVIIVSCVRLYLCVVGQWRDDGSWYYDPQVATEVAEISGTLIALSIPGLKALIGTVCERMRSTIDRTHPTSKGRVALTDRASNGATKLPDHASSGEQLKASVHTRVSSLGSDSDEDLLASVGSRGIFVHTDVAMTSIPMVHIRNKGRNVEEV